MKRINTFFVGIVVAVLFAGCGKSNKQDDVYEYSENVHQYEFDEMVQCFDVSRDGRMYCVSNDNEEIIISDLSEYHSYSNLFVLDEAGEVKETLRIPGYINQIQLEEEEQCLYYIDAEDLNHNMLYRYDLMNHSQELLWEIPEGLEIKKFFIIRGEIYVYGVRTDGSSIIVGWTNYFVGKLDLPTGQITQLPIKNPCCVSVTSDENLVIYVYENDTTYYFIEYDTRNQSFGEKIYHFLQGATEFYICNEENGYFYFKFKQDQTYLTYCELEPDAVEIELMPYERNGQVFITKYGNIFQLDKTQNIIKRVKNSVYMNDNKEIVLLSPMYYQGRNPFGCGYRTRNQYKDQEELALSVLSRDTDYDLF